MKYSLSKKEKRAALKFLKEQNDKISEDGYLEYKVSFNNGGRNIIIIHSITRKEKDITDEAF